MQNVKAIIDLFGGLGKLRHVRLEAPGFMPLVIEAVGTGPRGLPLVSVAHYYTQNGDLMRDPELTAEVGPGGSFHPVSFTQDNVGAYHEAVSVDGAGRVVVRPQVLKDLASFARQWDRNLRAQGFLDAARAAVRAAGCDGHLVKPLDPDLLHDLLRRRRAEKQEAPC